MTQNKTAIPLENRDNEDLGNLAIEYMDAIKALYIEVDRIRFIFKQRLEASNGATSIPHSTLDISFKVPTPKYDYGKLNNLKELLPEEVWSEAYVEPYTHEITDPEKWDMRKVKKFLKYGGEIAYIIESCVLNQMPTDINIKRKKE